ncbi:MAG: tetratricopeptide repeat protein [Deltaproteobacteria bacterium]|nr:tetratricopeptide repeat protein [Deltaproteobacteria bacterium]
MSVSLVILLGMLSTAAKPAGELRAAQAAFRDGEFDKALQLLDRAVAGSKNRSQLANIHLLRARCFNANGDLAKAEGALEEALVQDPESELDASRVPPVLVGLLTGLRQRLKADLRVTSDRAATIWLDGKALGETPLEVKVAIGRHRVQARAPDGALSVERELLLGPRNATEVTFSLPPPSAKPPPAALPALTPPVQPPAASESEQHQPADRLVWPWVTAGAGALAAAGGIWCGVEAKRRYDYLSGDRPLANPAGVRDDGERFQIAGYVLGGVGGAVVLTSAIFLIRDALSSPEGAKPKSLSSSIQLGVGAAPGGMVLSIEGRLP